MPSRTLAETMPIVAGRCLQYPIGQYHYSNTIPAFPTIILEQVMASGRYAAKMGKPETHQGSAQLGGNRNPKEWKLPPLDAKGGILDDFGKLKIYSGVLPDGVDIFVAVNQNVDRKCVEAKSYSCGDLYGLLDNFILYGVSQVNWGAIAP